MKRPRLALLGVLALALSLTVGLAASEATAAKKKKKKVGGTADITQQVNQQIPDDTATTNGLLASTITVGGKKFKGTVIRDVNVTVQGTGNNPNSASDIAMRVTAPNGTTTWLFGGALGGQSFGPVTFDDQSFVRVQAGTGGPRDSTELGRPYVGTAQPDCFTAHGGCTFSAMNNGPASGTYTLRAYDTGGAGATTVLNNWRLTVVAGAPYKT